jgi:hypothetical protein
MGGLELARLEYEKANYAEAARLFLRGYELCPRPEFLFNAARAEQRSFQLEPAIGHFEALLERKDLTPDMQKRARGHLTETREMLAREKALRPGAGPAVQPKAEPKAEPKPAAEPKAEPKPAAEPKAEPKASGPAGPGPAVTAKARAAAAPARWPALAALGGGGVLGLGAGVLWYLAGAARSDLQADLGKAGPGGAISGVTQVEARERAAEISGRETLAAGLGAGAAVAVGLGLWLLLDPPGGSAALVPVPGGLGLGLSF